MKREKLEKIERGRKLVRRMKREELRRNEDE